MNDEDEPWVIIDDVTGTSDSQSWLSQSWDPPGRDMAAASTWNGMPVVPPGGPGGGARPWNDPPQPVGMPGGTARAEPRRAGETDPEEALPADALSTGNTWFFEQGEDPPAHPDAQDLPGDEHGSEAVDAPPRRQGARRLRFRPFSVVVTFIVACLSAALVVVSILWPSRMP